MAEYLQGKNYQKAGLEAASILGLDAQSLLSGPFCQFGGRLKRTQITLFEQLLFSRAATEQQRVVLFEEARHLNLVQYAQCCREQRIPVQSIHHEQLWESPSGH